MIAPGKTDHAEIKQVNMTCLENSNFQSESGKGA